MKPLIFAIIVIPALIYLSNAYTGAASKNHVNAWNRQRAADFYALEGDSLDMLFIGSSHSYCTFAPELIDKALGTQSFQFGMPLQFPDSSWFTLREALKTQSPSVVVMELFWGVMNQDFDVKQADTLFQAFDNEQFKQGYINAIFPWNEKIKYAFPIIRYQQDFLTYEGTLFKSWVESRFNVSVKAEAQTGTERYDYRGFMYCDYVIPESKFGPLNQFANFDGKKWTFSKVQRGYLEKIIDLCAGNNIRLLFVTAPVAPISMEKIKNYDVVYNTISGFTRENKIPYLDFNAENQARHLFQNINFRDDAHLNYSGVEIADAFFAQWVKSMGLF